MSDMGSDDGLKAIGFTGECFMEQGAQNHEDYGLWETKKVSNVTIKQAFETFDSIPVSCQLCDIEQEISPVSQSLLTCKNKKQRKPYRIVMRIQWGNMYSWDILGIHLLFIK